MICVGCRTDQNTIKGEMYLIFTLLFLNMDIWLDIVLPCFKFSISIENILIQGRVSQIL